MSPVTQQGFIPPSLNVTVSAAQNTKITNLSLPLANTEYSHPLTSNLKGLELKARGKSKLQIAFTPTESGTKYITVPGLTSYTLSNLDFTGKTLYIQSDTASSVVEILELY